MMSSAFCGRVISFDWTNSIDKRIRLADKKIQNFYLRIIQECYLNKHVESFSSTDTIFE